MRLLFGAFLTVLSTLELINGATTNLNDDADLEVTEKDYVVNHADPLNKSCLPHPKPADCAEVFRNGYKSSGVYSVFPKNRILTCEEIKVYCDMKTDGGGWTVIQRRGNFRRVSDYFYKSWNEYKTGFGNLEKDFWLGNDNIYALTNQKKYSARFDLGTNTEAAYATYDVFWIENEASKYKLHIAEYSGTAGDSMEYHQNKEFSTKDSNNSISDCPNVRKGGWWYNDCARANLNGVYLKGNYTENMVNANGTYWRDWKGYKVSLTTVEIKIRPFNFRI